MTVVWYGCFIRNVKYRRMVPQQMCNCVCLWQCTCVCVCVSGRERESESERARGWELPYNVQFEFAWLATSAKSSL